MTEKTGRGRGKASATVVKLPTRKAKGTSGAKRSSKPVNRLKTDASQGAALTQDQIDAQARRAQIERVAALTNQHRLLDNKMDGIRATLDEQNQERKLVRTAIQNAGIPLEVFDERYDKMKLKTKRTDLEAIERARAICSEAMGLIASEQAQFDFAKLPEGAKVATYWRSVGYQAGVSGESCDPARDGCPPEATQDYNTGWGEGQTVVAAGIKLVKSDTAKAKDKAKPANDAPKADAKQTDIEDAAKAPAPKTTAQPDWSAFSNDPADWTDEQRLTFANWYRALDPDIEIDITHPGVECAFDRQNDGDDPFTGEKLGAA